MNRQEFESLYLGKLVELTMFNDKILVGELHKTEEERFKNDPNLNFRHNYYTLFFKGDTHYVFRKSNIKKVEVLK